MNEKYLNEINEEIEKELLKYQEENPEPSETSNFSWPQAIAYILIIAMFIVPVLVHIFIH